MAGSLAQQKLPPGVSWVKTSIKSIPRNAYVGGWEDGGKRQVYIGRAQHKGMLIPGKVIQFWGGMFFPLLGKEVKNTQFEILVADNPNVLKWASASGGNVPNGAIQGGFQHTEPVYIARGINPYGEPTPGKLHPPWGFFLSWGGTEHQRNDYEVLVSDVFGALVPAPIPALPLKQPPPVAKPPELGAGDQQNLPAGAFWLKTDIHGIPPNAFVGGYEDKGKRHVFVGRAEHHGSIICGKAIPFWGGMFFPLGYEVKNTTFEVLVVANPKVFKWVPASGAAVPKNAVQGGIQHGDTLYIARGINPIGEPTPGKLHPPYGFFLSWGGKEHHRKDYEVLVIDEPYVVKDKPKGGGAKEMPKDKGTKQITERKTATKHTQETREAVSSEKIQGPVYWVQTTKDNIPKNAVVCSKGLYIGRVQHKGDLIPGKVVPSSKKLFYPFFHKEHSSYEYEILVSDQPSAIKWVMESDGRVPEKAFQGGHQGGEPLYIGRAKASDGKLCPGKAHPPHGFFLSYGGKEHFEDKYEVLIVTRTSDKTSDIDKASDFVDSLNELSVDKPSEERVTDRPCV